MSSFTESSIFRNEEVLSFDYLPEILPHREGQTKFLADCLKLVGRGKKSQNVFIHGPPGIGKTASVKFVFREFSEEFPHVKMIYLNCWDYNTAVSILSEIANSLDMPSIAVQRRGWGKDEIISKLKEGLDKSKKNLVVCLDEVDQLIRKGQGALYDLSRINQYIQNPVAVILISNDPHALANLEPRTYSSLAAEDIEFKPYNLEEMKDILQERARYGLVSIEDGVIALAANHAIQKGGDVRVGLQCLMKAGRIAEEENANKLKVEHMRKVLRDVVKVKPGIVKENLNENEKIISEILSGGKIWKSDDLFNKYSEISSQPVGIRMFENYLNHLKELNLIRIRKKRTGNVRLISKM